ncbi:MAG: hypothetical protein RMK80_05135 [Pseudobdellovibrionaceae bacterium]|nr:hypothetical protein [Pseudobdellovibrionaceae bacterium]
MLDLSRLKKLPFNVKSITTARLVTLPLMTIFLLTCAEQEESLLNVSLKFENVIFVDTTGRSCVLRYKQAVDSDAVVALPDDLPAIKTRFGGVKIEWKGEAPINILFLRVVFEIGLNQRKAYMIEGDELSALFKGANYLLNPEVQITPLGVIDSSSVTNPCPFEIGGLNVPAKDSDASGTGYVIVYGVTEEGGRQVPYQGRTEFTWDYKGVQ